MILEHDGVAKTHKEWATEYGIPPRLILARLDCGWPVAYAIEAPMECPPGFRLGDLTVPKKRRGGRGAEATIFIEHDGLKLSLTEWSQRLGIARSTIAGRLRKGLPIEDVLSEVSRRGANLNSNRGGGGKQLPAVAKESGAPARARLRPNRVFHFAQPRRKKRQLPSHKEKKADGTMQMRKTSQTDSERIPCAKLLITAAMGDKMVQITSTEISKTATVQESGTFSDKMSAVIAAPSKLGSAYAINGTLESAALKPSFVSGTQGLPA